MNTIFIVLPILFLLMFGIGLTLKAEDFRMLARRPRAMLVGVVGQILFLPLIALGVGFAFKLEPVYFVGLMLIACSPGGSASNVFSMLAGGDVALSVALTAVSSLVTLVTIPLIMSFVMWILAQSGSALELPIGNLLMQNLVLMLLPIGIGLAVKKFSPKKAVKIEAVLKRVAFPLLMTLVVVFFFQHKEDLIKETPRLGWAISLLIILAMGAGAFLGRILNVSKREKRTLLIEIGMQNAAQAITLATSPLVFANEKMAIPPIIYALLMNVILLIYVQVVRKKSL